jgi:CRISPR system Cascade subunit CasE
MSDDRFHMVQLNLDARQLAELGRMLKLPLKRVDQNYLTHCALGELFGDHAPKPFSIENRADANTSAYDSNRQVRVLGYTDKTGEALRGEADTFASPKVHGICDWDTFASKPMPARFEAGTRLGFGLHVCPVQRMSSDGPKWSEGSEVDAFLVRCWEVGEEVEVDRGEVYQEWLTGYFERRGGAVVEQVSMTGFSLERFFRRTHGGERKGVTFTKPATTLQGVLEVTEPQMFAEILRGGIGRHKSFGFGMLKLRRPGRS